MKKEKKTTFNPHYHTPCLRNGWGEYFKTSEGISDEGGQILVVGVLCLET